MITQIDIENVRSYTKRVIDFSPQGNFIYGLNGKGKSTLIEMILFSFFGTIGLRTKKEEAIRDPAKSAEVTLRCDFSPLGAINITRSLTSNKAELSSVSHHITSGPQITKFFTKLFVSSPQLFQHTFVSKQKEVDLLSRLDRSKRRDLLTELLGLDILDSMVQLITEDTKSIQVLPDLTELRSSVNQIEDEVKGLDFNVLMRIQQLQTELMQSSDKDIKPKLDKFESVYYSLITLSESLKVKIDLYALGLETIDSSCPLCLTPLTQEQVSSFHTELTQLKTKLIETRHLLDKVVPILNNLRTLSSRRPKTSILTELGSHKDMDISYFLSKLSTLEKKRGILSLYNDIDISAVKTKRELKELLSSFRLKCLQKFFSEIIVYVSSLLRQCSEFNKFEVDENLDIYVDGRTLTSFSGGETDLICTALRICISKYMAYLRFGYIPLIILDSCFDSLDREKAQGVISALEHDPSLKQLIITGHRTLDLIPNTNVIYL